MAVQEIHGIFQFADDFFEDEAVPEQYVLPDYTPRYIAPQWYASEEQHDRQAVVKHHIDWLFYTGEYAKACHTAAEFIRTSEPSSTRRELYEAALVCAAKAGDVELAVQVLGHLESLRVEDAGLDFSPFWIAHFENDDAVRAVLSRTILIMQISELLAWGGSVGETVANAKGQLDESFYEPYRLTPFKFDVDDYMRKMPYEEQVRLINQFAFMPLKGPVSMKKAEVVFTLHCNAQNGHCYLGRLIGEGRRDLVDRFNLKKRGYLGTTSMDAELSLVMCNMARVEAGSLVYDPFVGTGSFLCTTASFGAHVLGSDIDGRQMRGSEGRNIHSNMQQYGVSDRLIGGLVFDILQHPWREGFQVDAIVTDPPYGVRAGAKKIGLKGDWIPSCKFLSPEEKAVRYPKTVPYEMEELALDLHELAKRLLRVGGRLVYWYPVEEVGGEPGPEFGGEYRRLAEEFGKGSRRPIEEYRRPDETAVRALLPVVEGIELISLIPQRCRHFDRWLVTCERRA